MSYKAFLVTGGRDFADYNLVRKTLDEVLKKYGVDLLVQGGATGADALSKKYRRLHALRPLAMTEVKPNWKVHGKAAGPIRNRFMLENWKPLIVVAFPGGRGTADCVRQARELGFPILEVR